MLVGDAKKNWEALKNEFHSYFGKSPLDIFLANKTVFTRTQRPGEKVRDYVAQMQKLASKIPKLQDDLMLYDTQKSPTADQGGSNEAEEQYKDGD